VTKVIAGIEALAMLLTFWIIITSWIEDPTSLKTTHGDDLSIP